MSNPRYSIIPAGAVTDRTLEPRDLQVLCLLGRHTDKAGWCVRSQVKMAQEIACSRGSLQNSLDRLDTAGWIDKKRRDLEVEEAGKRPSRSYAYRVLLDRDDYTFDAVVNAREEDETESYAENASEEGGCQPAGTQTDDATVPTEQHAGANACVSTPAIPYVGTKNVPLERPLIERERDARARERTARFLVDFEKRWPSAAADDRQRTAYAAEALTSEEQEAAITGIAPFLENLKRLHRKNVPAGWRYLEEKRWTLLEQDKSTAPRAVYPADSPEAKAIKMLHEIAGRSEAYFKIWRRPDGTVNFPKAMTPQLLALAQSPDQAEWISLERNQAAAWEQLLDKFFDAGVQRHHPKLGSKAPWHWPPKADGAIYTATGPPDTLMTTDDYANI